MIDRSVQATPYYKTLREAYHLRIAEMPVVSLPRALAMTEAVFQLAVDPTLIFIPEVLPPYHCISRFQKHTDVTQCTPFVRRVTGGSMVDVQNRIMLAIVTPKEHPLSTMKAYPCFQNIHQALLLSFQALGQPCHLYFHQRKTSPTRQEIENFMRGTCFKQKYIQDLITDTGLKIAATARYKARDAVYFETCINPLSFDKDDLINLFTQHLSPILGKYSRHYPLGPDELDLAETLYHEKYNNDRWNKGI